jgi:TPR repeat protein
MKNKSNLLTWSIVIVILLVIIFHNSLYLFYWQATKNYIKIADYFYEKEDFQKAFFFYNKSCNEGYIDECEMVGKMYEKGEGVKQNYIMAVKLYSYVCDKEEIEDRPFVLISPSTGICRKLAHWYENNPQDRADYAKLVFYYYNKACKHGDNKSCMDVALLYLTGQGTDKNIDKAKELYEKMCLSDEYSCACISLGDLYATKQIDVKDSYQQAKFFYDKAN